MPSLAEFTMELVRQKATGDNRFYRNQLFFFELKVPADLVSGDSNGSLLYPLIVNPESYSLTEPFSLEKSYGQGGALFTEENGIVERTIRLSGSTGFKPRSLNGARPIGIRSPDKRSFSRDLRWNLPPDVLGDVKLSGHAHFMYLQDTVFRTYADLKRDPAASEKTLMYFHNYKDDEHWLVAPQKFELKRTNSKRTLYYYDIELLILDKASAIQGSEDSEMLDRMRTALAVIGAGADLLTGAINDVTALVNEVKTIIKNVSKIIDSVKNVISTTKDFLDGVTGVIKAPYAILHSTRELIEEALSIVNTAEELRGAAINFPDSARQIFRSMVDGLDLIGVHPQAFASPAQLQMDQIRQRQEKFTALGKTKLAETAAGSKPTTFAELNAVGTGPLAGDQDRARAESVLSVGRNVTQYTGALEVPITKGDTLVNLAARYLGDARQWQYIAILNGLKPPFISDESAAGLADDESVLSGVLGIGKKILIPNFSRPPQAQPLLSVLGVRMEEDAEAHLLGTDWALEPVMSSARASDSRKQFDIPIDFEGGAVDAKIVRGKANLQQAIGVRLRTEKGTDTMFHNLGVERIVGLGSSEAERAIGFFRVASAISQDPRIASVRNLEFAPLNDQQDLVEVEAEAEVRGFTQGTGIRAIA